MLSDAAITSMDFGPDGDITLVIIGICVFLIVVLGMSVTILVNLGSGSVSDTLLFGSTTKKRKAN